MSQDTPDPDDLELLRREAYTLLAGEPFGIPAPFHVDDRVTLYHGDALAVLRALPTGSVDGIVTDPPYSSGGFTRGDRTEGTGTKYSSGGNLARLGDFAGDNRDQRGFLMWCNLWMGECLRVVKPGGVLLAFTDWRQLPLTTDALQVAGWVWRGVVPWAKPTARPQMGRFTANCEYVVWGSVGQMAMAGSPLPGFYQGSAPRDRVHQTEKPINVMRSLVKIVPEGGVVCDPFMGSGTTGVAAVLEGRRFVGSELTEHYRDVAAERITTAVRGYHDDGEQMAIDVA